MSDLERFRDPAIAWAVRQDEDARSTLQSARLKSVILVEGVSDAAALETAAGRLGRDLVRERVCVILMGGVTNAAKFVTALDPLGFEIRGLCDAGEERYFRRAFDGTRHPFFVCVDDLEDEFIRALGIPVIERILDVNGDLATFRTFQNQPAQRGRDEDRQLHRFFGTIGGRKERYARILVEALEPTHIPQPILDVLG